MRTKPKFIVMGKVQSATLVSISVDKLIVCILKSREITALSVYLLDFHASQEVKNPRKRSIDSLNSSSCEKSLCLFLCSGLRSGTVQNYQEGSRFPN